MDDEDYLPTAVGIVNVLRAITVEQPYIGDSHKGLVGFNEADRWRVECLSDGLTVLRYCALLVDQPDCVVEVDDTYELKDDGLLLFRELANNNRLATTSGKVFSGPVTT